MIWSDPSLPRTGEADIGALNEVFRNMKRLGNGYLEREGIASKDKYYRKSIDMRYKGQFHEVELPISEAELSAEEIASYHPGVSQKT